MDKFQNLISKRENYTTLISIVNLVCEIAETNPESDKAGGNKLRYAIQMFHVVAKELHLEDKITNDLYEQCEKLTEEQIEEYINDAIELWNKVVPLFKRIKKFIKSIKCCKK
jgi:hypothetical protein